MPNRLIIAIGLAWAFLATSPVTQAPQTRGTPEEQALAVRLADFSRTYKAGDYPAADKALDDALDLAAKAGRHDLVGVILYNKACVAALAGRRTAALGAIRRAIGAGYTDYYKFASDADFDSLRNDPEFKDLMFVLRDRAGIKAHKWDLARTVASFPMKFDAPSLPAFLEMRREFALDSVVAGMNDDYMKLQALTEWTSRQWRHSPTGTASKTDPVTILREAKAGGRFICRDYAIVLAAVATAHHLPARVLNLLPRDVETRSEAHSVAEVWVPRFGKWVLADGQYGVIAEIADVPVNGVELQMALAQDDPRLTCITSVQVCREWQSFVLRNAFYFKIAEDQRRFEQSGGKQLVLVPQGAGDPRRFAGGHEEVFAGAIYISNPAPFYAAPR